MADATFAIAVSGLAVAGATAAWNIYTGIRDRARIIVNASLGEVGGNRVNAVIVKAVNTGRRPVTLARGYLRFRDGSTLIPPLEQFTTAFPKQLTEGTAHMIWFDVEQLKSTLKENGIAELPTHACFDDEAGRVYCKKLPRLPFLAKR